MSRLIDWYVTELGLRLDAKLPSDRVETIVREAEGHLRESVQRLVSKNIDLEAAERSAIQSYGQPEKVAAAYVRNAPQRLWGLHPRWIAAFGSAVAIVCWNFHWLTLAAYFDNFGESWQNYLAGLIGIGGLALIVLAARAGCKSNRFTVVVLTVVAAFASIPIVSYWMVGMVGTPIYQGVSRFHLDRDTPRIEQAIAKLDTYKKFIEFGIDQYRSASTEGWIPTRLTLPDAAKELGETEFLPAVIGNQMVRGGTYIVPRRYGVFAMVDGGVTALATVGNFEQAKNEWLSQGPEDLRQIDVQRRGMVSLLTSARQAQAGRLFFFNPELYEQTLIGTLILLPGLLLVDWIGALTPRVRRRWPGRALA